VLGDGPPGITFALLASHCVLGDGPPGITFALLASHCVLGVPLGGASPKNNKSRLTQLFMAAGRNKQARLFIGPVP